MLDRFVIQDNIVYVKSISRFGDETLRYFVPFSDRKSTIESIYCVETGGHLGIDKTLDKIRKRFFWPDLAKELKLYKKECYHCQSVKAP